MCFCRKKSTKFKNSWCTISIGYRMCQCHGWAIKQLLLFRVRKLFSILVKYVLDVVFIRSKQ